MTQRYFLHFAGRDKAYIYYKIHYTLLLRRTLTPPLLTIYRTRSKFRFFNACR